MEHIGDVLCLLKQHILFAIHFFYINYTFTSLYFCLLFSEVNLSDACSCKAFYVVARARVANSWNTLHDFGPDLQSGQADARCWKCEPVCRFELTDFLENHAVYDDNSKSVQI